MTRALAILLALSLALPARAQDAGVAVPNPIPEVEAPSDLPRAEKLERAKPAPFTGMLLNDAMLAKMDQNLAGVTRERELAKAERDLWKDEAAKTGIPTVTVVGLVVGALVVGLAAGVVLGVYAGAQASK